MAKPAYPGLVIVPPSDRWLLRRRLTRLAFLITAVTFCALAITHRLPSSGNKPNCQAAIDHEECDQPGPSTTEAQPGLSESFDIEVSRGVDQADSGSRITVADSDPHPDTRLAHQGDAFAQYRFGRFLAQRGEPHSRESVHWYRKASDGLRRLAEVGNGQAMYVLGVMNAFGRGIRRDTEEARRWLTQAVEHQVEAARPVLARLEEDQRAKQRDVQPKVAEPKAAEARAADPRDVKPTDTKQMDADPRAAMPTDAEPSLQARALFGRVRREY